MSDDFQTVTAKRGEALRTHYRRHREALMNLVSDAPSELIAAQYRRVIADIDIALAKLEGDAPPVPPPPPPARARTDAGMRPLVTTAKIDDDATISYSASDASDSRSRLLLIAAAAVIALAAIGWLIWRASDKPETGRVVEQPATTAVEEGETATRAAVPAGRPLVVTPDTIDYGIIRKGTRVTRQYEIVNNTEEPLSPQVSRSTCRCLYYEHAPVIPPKAKESLTVTIDGAKAKPGPLLESIRVSSKSDPSVVTTFDVTATVR